MVITIAILIVIFSQFIDGFYKFLLSTIGIIETTFVFFLYHYLRKTIHAKL